jgi:hypothetical protein
MTDWNTVTSIYNVITINVYKMSACVVSDIHYSVQQATAEGKRLIYMIQGGDGVSLWHYLL